MTVQTSILILCFLGKEIFGQIEQIGQIEQTGQIGQIEQTGQIGQIDQTRQVGQSFWTNLEGNVEQNQGWQEGQMMATNTTTPAYDPNTSTPGSTISLESITQPSESRRYLTKGRDKLSVQYNPVGESAVGSPIVIEAPVKYDNPPKLLELAPNSPFGIPVNLNSEMSKSQPVPTLTLSPLPTKSIPIDTAGIPISLDQAGISPMQSSKPHTVDSNVDYNLIMEPVAQYRSSPSKSSDQTNMAQKDSTFGTQSEFTVENKMHSNVNTKNAGSPDINSQTMDMQLGKVNNQNNPTLGSSLDTQGVQYLGVKPGKSSISAGNIPQIGGENVQQSGNSMDQKKQKEPIIEVQLSPQMSNVVYTDQNKKTVAETPADTVVPKSNAAAEIIPHDTLQQTTDIINIIVTEQIPAEAMSETVTKPSAGAIVDSSKSTDKPQFISAETVNQGATVTSDIIQQYVTVTTVDNTDVFTTDASPQYSVSGIVDKTSVVATDATPQNSVSGIVDKTGVVATDATPQFSVSGIVDKTGVVTTDATPQFSVSGIVDKTGVVAIDATPQFSVSGIVDKTGVVTSDVTPQYSVSGTVEQVDVSTDATVADVTPQAAVTGTVEQKGTTGADVILQDTVAGVVDQTTIAAIDVILQETVVGTRGSTLSEIVPQDTVAGTVDQKVTVGAEIIPHDTVAGVVEQMATTGTEVIPQDTVVGSVDQTSTTGTTAIPQDTVVVTVDQTSTVAAEINKQSTVSPTVDQSGNVIAEVVSEYATGSVDSATSTPPQMSVKDSVGKADQTVANADPMGSAGIVDAAGGYQVVDTGTHYQTINAKLNGLQQVLDTTHMEQTGQADMDALAHGTDTALLDQAVNAGQGIVKQVPDIGIVEQSTQTGSNVLQQGSSTGMVDKIINTGSAMTQQPTDVNPNAVFSGKLETQTGERDFSKPIHKNVKFHYKRKDVSTSSPDLSQSPGGIVVDLQSLEQVSSQKSTPVLEEKMSTGPEKSVGASQIADQIHQQSSFLDTTLMSDHSGPLAIETIFREKPLVEGSPSTGTHSADSIINQKSSIQEKQDLTQVPSVQSYKPDREISAGGLVVSFGTPLTRQDTVNQGQEVSVATAPEVNYNINTENQNVPENAIQAVEPKPSDVSYEQLIEGQLRSTDSPTKPILSTETSKIPLAVAASATNPAAETSILFTELPTKLTEIATAQTEPTIPTTLSTEQLPKESTIVPTTVPITVLTTQENILSEETIRPVQLTEMPTDSTIVPQKSTILPIELTTVEIDSTTVPIESTTVPVVVAESTTVPVVVAELTTVPVVVAESTTVPVVVAESTTVPVVVAELTTVPVVVVESTAVLVESTTVPVELKTVPVESTTVPVESTTVPVKSTTVLTEAPTIPIESTTVPTQPRAELTQQKVAPTQLESAASTKLALPSTEQIDAMSPEPVIKQTSPTMEPPKKIESITQATKTPEIPVEKPDERFRIGKGLPSRQQLKMGAEKTLTGDIASSLDKRIGLMKETSQRPIVDNLIERKQDKATRYQIESIGIMDKSPSPKGQRKDPFLKQQKIKDKQQKPFGGQGMPGRKQQHRNEILRPAKPEEPPLESFCINSAFIDGIGYAEYPGHCQKLVQCYQYRGRNVAVLRECPAGYFWHQDLTLCRPPAEVPCFDDPCLDIDVIHYNRSEGCRSFFSCEYGISVPQCCDQGFRYNGASCIPDKTCNDPCVTPYDMENSLRYVSCKFLPDEYNPYGYLTMEHHGLRIRACPTGTIFSARQCGCRWISGRRQSRRRMKGCRPNFYMNFNYGFKELSGSNMAFDVSNVVINDGAAQFNGNGKITLWGFMNKELGKKFAIRLKFKPDPNSTGKGSLVSNCGMTGSSTVSIGLEKHQLKLSAKSMSFSRPTVIKDHFDPYSWNDVTYLYNGNNFIVSTNGYKQRKPLGGLLETRSNAIVIGGCPRPGTGFKGLIDSIEIFSGCIPRNIYKPRKQQ